MLITKRSMITGIEHTRDVQVTEDQLEAWASGGLIQEVMPHVPPADREFLMTGITGEEWEDNMHSPDDDDMLTEDDDEPAV